MSTNPVSTSVSKMKSLTADDFYSELISMRNQIDKLIDKILSLIPPKYGSDAWWEKSDREALKQLKEGKGKTFNNVEELEKYLGI